MSERRIDALESSLGRRNLKFHRVYERNLAHRAAVTHKQRSAKRSPIISARAPIFAPGSRRKKARVANSACRSPSSSSATAAATSRHASALFTQDISRVRSHANASERRTRMQSTKASGAARWRNRGRRLISARSAAKATRAMTAA